MRRKNPKNSPMGEKLDKIVYLGTFFFPHIFKKMAESSANRLRRRKRRRRMRRRRSTKKVSFNQLKISDMVKQVN